MSLPGVGKCGVETVELRRAASVGFFGHVSDASAVSQVILRVFPEAGRPSNRDRRPSTPDSCIATADSEAETQVRRSPILGCSISSLVALAFRALDRETSHSYRLAPPRFPLVLDLESSPWKGRTTMRGERNTRTDSHLKPRQCGLGSAENLQRTSQAGHQNLRSLDQQVHDPTSEATIAKLADIPEESCNPARLGRLLHRSDGIFRGFVRVYRDPA